MITNRINNLKRLRPNRMALRSNSSPAEIILWQYLRKYGLRDRKFRRQHSIGNYVLDFYCPSEKLAIELDGDSHFSNHALEYDAIRDRFLRSLNIRVLRINNCVVFENIDIALELIISEFSNPH